MSKSWTNVYVNFSLPTKDREALDVYLRERGSSLGQEFHHTVRQCLEQAGLDPSGLDGVADSSDDHARHH